MQDKMQKYFDIAQARPPEDSRALKGSTILWVLFSMVGSAAAFNIADYGFSAEFALSVFLAFVLLVIPAIILVAGLAALIGVS